MTKKGIKTAGSQGNKQTSFLGITLIFYQKENGLINGFLKSYSVKRKAYEVLMSRVEQIVRLETEQNRVIHLGINDIYKVSGKALAGEFLGRSSLYDLNTYKSAKGLIGSRLDSSSFLDRNEMRNCSLLYYYSGRKRKFTFTVLTILESESQEQFYEKAYELGTCPYFLKKIEQNSSDSINLKNVHFVGVESSFTIKDLHATGCYQEFNASFDHIDLIKEELMSEKEIAKSLSRII